MDVTEAEFYDQTRVAVLPMGFCFPGLNAQGGDRPPRPECAPAWRRAILEAMPQVELVLAIGLYAQRWHLGREAAQGLSATVRRYEELLAAPTLPRCLPLPHSSWRNNAWLKANPWFDREVVPALRRSVRQLI